MRQGFAAHLLLWLVNCAVVQSGWPQRIGALRWLSWYTYEYKDYSLAGTPLDANHTSLFMEHNLSAIMESEPRPTLFFLARDAQLGMWDEATMKMNVARRRGGESDLSVLPVDWRARLMAAAHTLRRRAGPGGIEGVQLGDELICRGVPPSNLSSVAAELRRQLPADVWLFTNECKGVHYCRTPGAKSWISPFLDVVAVDVYSTSAGTNTSAAAGEAAATRAYYEEWVFPHLHAGQSVAVVPGLFAKSGDNHTAEDGALTAKLLGYETWAQTEPRIVGIVPWHWDSFDSTFPEAAYRRGACEFQLLRGEVARLRRAIPLSQPALSVSPQAVSTQFSTHISFTADPPVVVSRVQTRGAQARFPATCEYVHTRKDRWIITSFSDQSDALHDAGFTGQSFVSDSKGSNWHKVSKGGFPWVIIGVVPTHAGGSMAFSYPLRHVVTGSQFPRATANVQSAELRVTADGVTPVLPSNMTVQFPVADVFHQPLNAPKPANESFAFSTSGRVLPLRTGGLVGFVYGTFTGLTMANKSLVATKSTDGGRSWKYHSMIAGFSDPSTFAPSSTPELCREPNENAAVRLANGSILTIFRSTHSGGGPLCSAFSHNEATTWTVPVVLNGCKQLSPGVPGPWGAPYHWGPKCIGAPANKLPDWWLFGVRPQLTKLPNGLLVMTTGRPGIWLYVAEDTWPLEWQRLNLAEEHNRLVGMGDLEFSSPVPGGGVNGTSSYTGLLSLDEDMSGSNPAKSCHSCSNDVLVTYDRLGSGWEPLGDGQVSAVFSMKITIRRTS